MKITRRAVCKIVAGATFLIVFSETAVLHYNRQRPTELIPLRVEYADASKPYYPRLICRIRNPRITPAPYLAVSESMVGYENVYPDTAGDRVHKNSWCTADFKFTLGPLSSREIWIWIPDAPERFTTSIYFVDRTLLSTILPFLERTSQDSKASAYVNLTEIPNKPGRGREPLLCVLCLAKVAGNLRKHRFG